MCLRAHFIKNKFFVKKKRLFEFYNCLRMNYIDYNIKSKSCSERKLYLRFYTFI